MSGVARPRFARLGLLLLALVALPGGCRDGGEEAIEAPTDLGTLRVVMGLSEAEWRVVRDVAIAPFERETGARVVPCRWRRVTWCASSAHRWRRTR